jgi:eukaryotic-like serine/threonine-protein kinase
VTGLVSFALIAGTTISTWQALRATAAEKRMAATLVEAEEHRRRAERHVYAFSLRQVQRTIEQGQVERAQERLSSLRDELGEPDTSDFAWHYLRHLAFREIAPFVKHHAEVRPMSLSPDRRLLASGDDQGVIILTDLASGQTRLRLIGPTATLNWLAFSPDGKLLASITDDSVSSNRHEVSIWDLATARRLAKVDLFKSTCIWGLGFSSSSRRLLAAFEEPGDPVTVQLFDLESIPAQPMMIHSLQVRPVYHLALDHTHLVAQPVDHLLTTFETEELQTRWSASDPDRGQSWPVLSVDGHLVCTSDGHSVLIRDTATGHEVSCFSPANRCPRS